MNKKLLVPLTLFSLFLLLLNFYLLVFDFNFYEKEFYRYDIYTKYSKETIDSNAKDLIKYMKFNQDTLSNFFNQKEKLHMADVRNLIHKAEYVLLFSFIILLMLLLLDRSLISKTLYYGSLLTIILFVLAILLSSQFPSIFYNFHLLAFNNDYWMLDPEKDNLKYMFPNEFFYDFVKTMFLRTFIISLIIIFISRKDLYINKLRELIWHSQK